MSCGAIIILFIFGATIGSFLNVVTLRYELLGKMLFTRRIGGRSHCPQCKTTLRWHELIPLLSFVLQWGKCRHCSHRLSVQYPIIEALTGLLTAGIPAFLYRQFDVRLLSPEALPVWFMALCALWIIAAYVFVALSLIDLKHTIIPDAANVLLGAIGVAIVLVKTFAGTALPYGGSFLGNYSIFWDMSGPLWLQALAAALLGFALFGAIILFTRGRGMGLGDLKLVVPIGLLFGWPDIVLVLAASFVIGAIVSVFLMMFGRKSFKDGVPFGPFLAVAAFAVFFAGERIMSWYFSLV